MKRLLLISLLPVSLFAQTAHWRFDGDCLPFGEPAVFQTGAKPEFSSDVSNPKFWDGQTFSANKGSIRFTRVKKEGGSIAPEGGEVLIPAKAFAPAAGDLTIEAVVKIPEVTGAFGLIVSKRRNGQLGSSVSLSVDPKGTATVRCDTQPAGQASGPGMNQLVSSGKSIADGEWHHVAFVYNATGLSGELFIDYELAGRIALTGPLVYDESPLTLGRGINGWMDEVRISPSVLHPEDFLRPTRRFTEMKPKPVSQVFLDQSYTRSQTFLRPDMTRLGTLIPKNTDSIGDSNWSLGCETLDRDLASWDAYKGYLKPLGIKRVRLQGGWNKTEKEKGVYDWKWLDEIVEDAHARGLTVCLETSYHCRLYNPKGATGPGGELPAGEEVLAAWDKWVEAMARRYSAKGVKEWMMYNEPNLTRLNTVDRIVENNIRTAEIIKRVDPEAKIAAFVVSNLNYDYLVKLITAVKARNKQHLFHWACYHGYGGNPDALVPDMRRIVEFVRKEVPEWRLWQGESGCASEEVQFALSGIDWTEYSHAKWNARRMITDAGCGIDSLVFTMSDLAYHKDFISRYGLLKTNPDCSLTKVKQAYYMVQNVVSVFNESLALDEKYQVDDGGARLLWFGWHDKKTGLDVVPYWNGSEIPGNGSETKPVTLVLPNCRIETPVLFDVISGNIWAIPSNQIQRAGTAVKFTDLPCYDSPLVITDKSLLTYEPARPKKAKRKPAVQLTEEQFGRRLCAAAQEPRPAVIICGETPESAERLAKSINNFGIHAFVLSKSSNITLARQTLLAKAAEWQIKENAIGILLGSGAPLETASGLHFAVLCGNVQGNTAVLPKKTLKLPNAEATARLGEWLEQFKKGVFQ